MLIGTGLMIESLRRLLRVDTGFDGNVLTMGYRPPENSTDKYQQKADA